MTLLIEFAIIFAIVLVLGYLAPAGAYYWLFHVHAEDRHLDPIQHRRPTAKDIRREVQLSISTVVIFSVMATALYELYKAGYTNIYWNLRDYPYGFLFVSVFAALAVHDTWFYWTHRFMHWRPVFKYTHLGHHRSVSPTPWAIYAFQPAEAFLQFLGIAVVIMIVPLHPLGMLLFFWIDAQVNTAGHTGYELVPRFIRQSPWFQGCNTVTHHDLHHTHPNKNFGSFFNVWDRWMGTYLPDEAAENHGVVKPVPAEVAEHDRKTAKPSRSFREQLGGLVPQLFAERQSRSDHRTA
ncbi:sterol desaturase family protein [Anatilimnocola floriformis]|uniref:sterol desaturase family protein n=1 Tax=Anatilimnocola floriformis TaxID=2948575 RepID=UPI0020C4C97C|nr:sterol desaturase family protein [Anatilimnocola floriformis]